MNFLERELTIHYRQNGTPQQQETAKLYSELTLDERSKLHRALKEDGLRNLTQADSCLFCVGFATECPKHEIYPEQGIVHWLYDQLDQDRLLQEIPRIHI